MSTSQEEGHDQQKQEGGQGRKEQEEHHHQALSLLHQAQPQEQGEENLLRHQEEDQWQGCCMQGWEKRMGLEPTHLSAQGSHHQHDELPNGVGSQRSLKIKHGHGGFGGLATRREEVSSKKSQAHKIGHMLPKSPI